MHPTADTNLVINLSRAGRRVMPGVRWFPLMRNSMRKLTIQFVVALLTFSFGVGLFLLCGSLQAVEEIPAPRQRPAIPEEWKKVEAEGKFSFYIPPGMRPVELSCYLSDWERGDMLANENLLLTYGYGA